MPYYPDYPEDTDWQALEAEQYGYPGDVDWERLRDEEERKKRLRKVALEPATELAPTVGESVAGDIGEFVGGIPARVPRALRNIRAMLGSEEAKAEKAKEEGWVPFAAPTRLGVSSPEALAEEAAMAAAPRPAPEFLARPPVAGELPQAPEVVPTAEREGWTGYRSVTRPMGAAGPIDLVRAMAAAPSAYGAETYGRVASDIAGGRRFLQEITGSQPTEPGAVETALREAEVGSREGMGRILGETPKTPGTELARGLIEVAPRTAEIGLELAGTATPAGRVARMATVAAGESALQGGTPQEVAQRAADTLRTMILFEMAGPIESMIPATAPRLARPAVGAAAIEAGGTLAGVLEGKKPVEAALETAPWAASRLPGVVRGEMGRLTARREARPEPTEAARLPLSEKTVAGLRKTMNDDQIRAIFGPAAENLPPRPIAPAATPEVAPAEALAGLKAVGVPPEQALSELRATGVAPEQALAELRAAGEPTVPVKPAVQPEALKAGEIPRTWLNLREKFENSTPEERVRLLQELHTQTRENPVTKLPGIRALEDRIAEFEGAGKESHMVAFDLNGFKAAQDRVGSHEAGDMALKEFGRVAQEIASKYGADNHISHLHGDEFMLHTGDPRAQDIAAEIRRHISENPFTLTIEGHDVTFPVGTEYGYGRTKAAADRALYEAKKARPTTEPRGEPAGVSAPARQPGVESREGILAQPAEVAAKPSPRAAAGIERAAEVLPPPAGTAAAPEQPAPAAASPRPSRPPVQRESIERAFPKAAVAEAPYGWTVTHEGKPEIKVVNVGKIRPDEASLTEHGLTRQEFDEGGYVITGSFGKVNGNNIIKLAKGAAKSETPFHEAFHAATELALTPPERRAILRRYETEEAAAAAYEKWAPGRQAQLAHEWGFRKIFRYFRNLAENLGLKVTPERVAEKVFERVERGKVWKGKATAARGAPGKLAVEMAERQPEGRGFLTEAERNRSRLEKGKDTVSMIRSARRAAGGPGRFARAYQIWSGREEPGTLTAAPGAQATEARLKAFTVEGFARDWAAGEKAALAAVEQAKTEPAPKDLTKFSIEEGVEAKPVPRAFPKRTGEREVPTDLEELRREGKVPPPVVEAKAKYAVEKPPENQREFATDIKQRGPQAVIDAIKSGNVVPRGGKPPEEFVNWDRINSPDDVKAAMQAMVDAMPETAERARGKRTWDEDERAALGDALVEGMGLGGSEARRIVRSGAVNSRSILAMGMAKDLAAKHARDAVHKVVAAEASGKNVAEAQLEYLRDYNRAAGLLFESIGARAEAGRALAICRKVTEGLDVKDALAQYLLKHQASPEVFKMIATIDPADTASVVRVMRMANKPGMGSMISEAVLSGLMSGVKTHARNVLSNLAAQSLKFPEKALASALDRGRVAFKGGPRERYLGEVYRELTGIIEGVPNALIEMGRVWREENVDWGKIESARLPALPGKVGKFVRGPLRAAGAEDAFAGSISKTQELRAQAYRKAQNDVAAGRTSDVNTREREILSDLSKHPEIAKAAQKARDYWTYRGELGQLSKYVLAGLQKYPVGRLFVAPFFKTPVKLFGFYIERSPIGLARSVYKIATGNLKGGEAADALSRGIIGSMIFGWLAHLAQQGVLQGMGPEDSKERANKMATGWQPYSLKLGNQYLSFQGMEPVSSMMMAAADAVQVANEKDKEKILSEAGRALRDLAIDKSSLVGFERLALTLSQPDRYLKGYAYGSAGLVTPTIGAHIAQAIDPTVRQKNSFWDAIKARVPFASKSLPEKKTVTGKPIVREQSVVEMLVSPFIRTIAKSAPLEREFDRIGYVPGWPRKAMTIGKKKVELTDAEFALYDEAAKSAAARAEKIIKTGYYKAASDDPTERGRSKQDILEKIFREERAKTKLKIVRGRRLRPQVEEE